MATIDLLVFAPGLEGTDGPGQIETALLARLRRLDPGEVPQERERSVAVSLGDRGTRISNLDAGDWEIQLILPSGEILSKDVELRSDEAQEVRFEAIDPPENYLAWQHFAGGLPGRERRSERPDRSRTIQSDSGPEGEDQESIDPEAPEVLYGAGAQPPLPFSAKPTIYFFLETQQRGKEPSAKARWRRLVEALEGRTSVASVLTSALVPPSEGFRERGETMSWQLPDELFDRAAEGKHHRFFAVIELGGAKELVSLPAPWYTHPRHPGAAIDLLVDRGARQGPFRTKVVIQDEGFGGPLAYMTHGSVGAAGQLFREAWRDPEMQHSALRHLMEKFASPLGACAGAYALAATSDLASDAEWHAWIRNLSCNERFWWLPDGAILHAWLELRRSRTEEDARGCLAPLHSALRRGLPYYATGLAWLLEIMFHFKEDALVAECLPLVDRAARRLDTSQAFLVLKADKRP